MVVEHAERFGLSQLHQLRGRVGRGAWESHCILLYQAPWTDDARERLKAMSETSDGFAIAERDLELRGPGDFFGTRQSGLPKLRTGDLVRDRDIMEDGAPRGAAACGRGRVCRRELPAVRAATWQDAVRPDRSRITTKVATTTNAKQSEPSDRERRASWRRMRVIAGRFKGRRLKAPDLGRSSPDVRQAARDALQHPGAADDGARVLDGFAGHGRRRHRGAEPRRRARHLRREATARAAALIEENLKACGVEGGYTIQCAEIVAALDALPAADAFDLILLDPPYDIDHDQRRARRRGGAPGRGAACVVLERATRREPDVPACAAARCAT